MNLNLLDITIIVILAFYLISGMYRGFITSLLGTVGFVGAWFGAQQLYPRVANLALSNQTLMAVLNQYLEPESFFESHTQAVSTVSEVIAGGEAAIQSAVASVSGKLSVVSKAFEANVRAQMFQRLGINTLADYLDQTIWQAVFNVGAFLLCFSPSRWCAALTGCWAASSASRAAWWWWCWCSACCPRWCRSSRRSSPKACGPARCSTAISARWTS